jgi:hypothetical protein
MISPSIDASRASGKSGRECQSIPLGSRQTRPERSMPKLSLMKAVAASNATSAIGLAVPDMQAARQLLEA